MDKIEVRLIALELYQDYGKTGAVDACFEHINESKNKQETVFWENVLRYIENNFDDDSSFMFGEY